jgi:hypothetical protein
MKLANPPGAQFEILVDGKPRSYRDIKAVCHYRPQSSSASRFTAGASGFFDLSQSGERPERVR